MLILAALACQPGDDSDSDAEVPEVVLGDPLPAAPGEWTWFDIDGATCDDGSTTGVAVNPGTEDKLLVFLMGGGACWDYTTCFTLGTASSGPFSAAEWARTDGWWGGSVFDRTEADNPYKDWSFVFVPYCTGDLHGGDHVVTYTQGSTSAEYHHTGHTNLVADLSRVAPTFPNPEKVVISGASAGGGGVLLNYVTFKPYWPDAPMQLLDDSLPLMQGDDIKPWLRELWIDTWHLQPRMDEVCTGCADDFSLLHAELAARYPDDRMALLSTQQDETISGYLLISGESYESALDRLDANVLQPANNWERFFVPGDRHTMLGNPGDFATTGGDALWPWLTQMATDDPAWTSVGP